MVSCILGPAPSLAFPTSGALFLVLLFCFFPCVCVCVCVFVCVCVCLLSANWRFVSVTCIWKSPTEYALWRIFRAISPFRGYITFINQAIMTYLPMKTNLIWSIPGEKKTALWIWWSLTLDSILLTFKKLSFLRVWPRLPLPELIKIDFSASFPQALRYPKCLTKTNDLSQIGLSKGRN